jgi:2-dehydropantoate 2-reductase
MRIAIFGVGAVGGYFGGRLAQAGEDVVFIARGDHLKAIRNSGLRVDSVNGNFVIQPAQASDTPAGVGYVDAILVGVKIWQIPQAAEAMRPMVGSETFVVPLQNGVEAPMQLAKVLGTGHIQHAGIDPYIAFGEMDGHGSQRVQRLRSAFSRATGVIVDTPSDVRLAMWQKFLLIASWGGLGAVTRAPIGVIRSQPETRQMLQQSLCEIHAVAVAHRVPLPDRAIAETLEFIDTLPPHGTASVQRDIIEGRPSELAALSGAVVRLGREAGVEVPLHTFIYHSLLPLESRARGETWPNV